MSIRQQIPNYLTSLNLISGVLGIYLLFNRHHELVLCCIALSLIADLLDGWAARKLGVTGPLGIQLDSLADMVSFGVLPGLMLVSMNLQEPYSLMWIIGWIAGMILIVGAMWRLAKFNIDTDQRTGFLGLPTPAMAMYVSGMMLGHYYADYLSFLFEDTITLLITAFALAVLMNSSIPMPSLKDWSENKTFIAVTGAVSIIASIVCLVFAPELLLLVVLWLYICSALIFSQILKK